jgi:hypothetical protein
MAMMSQPLPVIRVYSNVSHCTETKWMCGGILIRVYECIWCIRLAEYNGLIACNRAVCISVREKQ